MLATNVSTPKNGAAAGSIAAEIAENPRRSGFDYLRIILAYLIMVDHSAVVCGGAAVQEYLFSGYRRPYSASLVPMFFALSGFLVASSLVRNRSLITFAGLRVLRIVPALAVDTVFCAIILGGFLTTWPLRSYFSSVEFAKYFLNIVGLIHYKLPGLFESNIIPKVNAQLWTIPFELNCYAMLTVFALFRLHKRPSLFLSATVAVMMWQGFSSFEWTKTIIDVDYILLPSFLMGVVVFLLQEKVKRDWRIFAMSLALQAALLDIQGPLMVLAAVPIAYNTVFLGLTDFKRLSLLQTGDYSYPLYLYSFPIQQAVFLLAPGIGRTWLGNLVISTPFALALAVFSWHLVEKPAQRQRKYLYKFEALREGWRRPRVAATVASDGL